MCYVLDSEHCVLTRVKRFPFPGFICVHTYHNKWEAHSHDDEAQPLERAIDHEGHWPVRLSKDFEGNDCCHTRWKSKESQHQYGLSR